MSSREIAKRRLEDNVLIFRPAALVIQESCGYLRTSVRRSEAGPIPLPGIVFASTYVIADGELIDIFVKRN